MGFLRFLKKYKNLVFIFVVVCVLCSLGDNGREGFREGKDEKGEGKEEEEDLPFWGKHKARGAWVGRNLDEDECASCKTAWETFLKSEKTEEDKKARLDACKPCRPSKESFTSGYF